MQRSELDSEIGRLLGDPTHDRWSLDTIHAREEFAQQDVMVQTGAVKSYETLTPTADNNYVTPSNVVIDVTGATWTDTSGNIYPMTFKSLSDLDFYRPNWRNESGGVPNVISYDPALSQIVLVPAPTSADITTNCLSVEEVVVPTSMTSDSSEPFNSTDRMQVFGMAIVHWVVAQCWMDDATPESLAKAKFHKSNDMDRPGEYEKIIRKINSRYKNPSAIPERIKWRPAGGLVGGKSWPTHENPFI